MKRFLILLVMTGFYSGFSYSAYPTGLGACSYTATDTTLDACFSAYSASIAGTNYSNPTIAFGSCGSSCDYGFLVDLNWGDIHRVQQYSGNHWNSYSLNPCSSGVIDATGNCTDPCPSGQVAANTIPALNTNSSQCVAEGTDYCGQIGVDVTAFVPQCGGAISGNPTSCLKSDLSSFSIPACPEITCADGSKVTYPNKCPITNKDCSSLGAGWQMVTLADGATQTCVMPTPDNEQNKPCFTISPTQAPVCAVDGQNCAMQNGQPVCISKQTGTPPPGATCYTNAGDVYCLSNQPTATQTKNAPVPLNLGNQACQSVTTTQKTNVVGDTGSTCTTITCPDGSATTSCDNPSPIQQSLAPTPANPGGTPKAGNIPKALGGSDGNAGTGNGTEVDLSGVEKNTADTVEELKKLTTDSPNGSGTAERQYTKKDKTYQSVFDGFKASVSGSPLITAASGVFSVNPSGTCPVWVLPETGLTPSINIDQQCSSVMLDVWPWISAVLMAVATFYAVRVAFL